MNDTISNVQIRLCGVEFNARMRALMDNLGVRTVTELVRYLVNSECARRNIDGGAQ